MNSGPVITDHDRYNFMQKLSSAIRDRNGLLLSPWENDFVASWLRSSSPTGWFTPPRRVSVDRMRLKYGGEREINMPHPDDLVTERPPIPAADPTGCQYLVKDDNGKQVRCNDPATCRDPGKLRYCEMHGDAVVKAMKHQRITLRLIRFP